MLGDGAVVLSQRDLLKWSVNESLSGSRHSSWHKWHRAIRNTDKDLELSFDRHWNNHCTATIQIRLLSFDGLSFKV